MCSIHFKRRSLLNVESNVFIDVFYLVLSRMLESLAGCRKMFPFSVSCKIGALERNAYWFHVELTFFVIFGQ